VQWTAHEFTAHDRGVLVLKGYMPIDTQARDIANAAFTAGLPDTPLTLEGGHFVEAVVDNRAGSGFVTLISLLIANVTPSNQLDRPSYQELTHFIQEVRLTADVVNTNEIDITL